VTIHRLHLLGRQGGQFCGVALLLILVAASAHRSALAVSASCSVSPDPVQSQPYPTAYYYTVTLTGAAPDSYYYVWPSQPHNNQITQQHPIGFLVTDSTGTGSIQGDGNDPTHVLQPGTVNVKVTNYPSGAKVASCSFGVT
jgi:hypothetical protein